MNADEIRETAAESAAEVAEVELPRRGEVWKWHWLWADIVKAGPKRVTYTTRTRSGWETSSVPTEQFMEKFHRTGLGASPAQTPADGDA